MNNFDNTIMDNFSNTKIANVSNTSWITSVMQR